MINEHDIEGLSPRFKEWLEETEVYSSRYERLCSTFAEFDAHTWKDLMIWLHAAYTVGARQKGVEHVELQHGRGTQG